MSRFDAIVMALDMPDVVAARAAMEAWPEIRRVKVGLELFLAAGFALVDALVREGRWVFLDLKLHDIPHTVERAVAVLCDHGVGLTTVHALGGPRMIAAARAARDRAGAATGIVAVTALTSHGEDEWQGLGMARGIAATAEALALQASQAGADGVVSSAHEVRALRAALGPAAVLVTPGLRLPGQDAGDQRRVATPGAARRDGATFLVMGRPLTAASDPLATAAALAADLHHG